MKNRILPVFIPFAGCRQRCVYCSQNSITGQNPSEILSSVEQQIRKYLDISDNWDELAYYGGSFTCLPDALQQRLYSIARGYGFKKLRFSTSPDCVTDANMAEAAAKGVETVEIGVQSLDDDVLKLNKRPCNSEETIQALHTVKKHIKKLSAQIMTGMYGENFCSFDATVTSVLSVKPEYVRIYPCVVLKDTELYSLWLSGEHVCLPLAETLARCAYGLILFEAEDIEVIRIGLQDAESMQEQIAAGEYHPATGDMVKTIAVAIYLGLGHNLALDRKYINTAYGYNGYNREACEGRLEIKEGAKPDIRTICKRITEVESYKRYIQRQAAFHAERLVGSPHNG
ncbi:radical SAM protein [Seleniivibrio sp.]|uniref:radical SAM protein n=1 Tax=Seleniivibrio sp. TaxID=2898801 RepID=UPI0025F355D2|nr:radical SAM protein [Seleniivibrio sp.]MCD8552598.1 radical SAM protein [Seleniivibrio sp.]